MRARKILLVDDSSEFRAKVQKALVPAFSVVAADSAAAFRHQFRPYTFDLVILDMRLEKGREGLGLLREILAHDALQPVIMVSAYGDTDAVLDSAQAGALMFLHKKEFTPELLARMVEAVLQQARIRRQLASLQSRVRMEDPLSLSAGNPLARRAAGLIEQAGNDPSAVVVASGEPGSGHDLAAAGVHARSARRSQGPFVVGSAGNAQANDPRTLLFGTADDNAVPRKKGLVEEANWGVLFLDRFDLVDADLQSEVVRAVATRQIGGASPVPLDVQLVLGTAPDTAEAVAGAVKEHWPAARVIEVTIPALRERREDIPLLAAFFLQELRREGRTTARAFSKEALGAMEIWDWPGNLHELRAVVGYAGVQALVEGGDEIERRHLPRNMTERAAAGTNGHANIDVHAFLARAEADLVAETMETERETSKKRIAELLGYTDRFAFSRRMRKILAEHPEIGKEHPKIAALFR